MVSDRKHAGQMITSVALVLLVALVPAAPLLAAIPGDINNDGVVNLFDLVLVSLAYRPGLPVSDARADTNGDGKVDLFDLVTVSLNYGAGTSMGPSPSRPIGYAAVPTSRQYPANIYSLQQQRNLSGYTVSLWESTTQGWRHQIVTIDAAGQKRIQIEDVESLDALTGSDVTGDGTLDVVIHTFTQGAHCCFSLIIYELGATPFKALETPPSNCPSSLVNLDADRALEVETCDDLFAYLYCSYASSPLVKVYLDYRPGVGYIPASPRFASLYALDIAAHTFRAERTVAGQGCDLAGESRCAVLAVVLDHLYSGAESKAWSELRRIYRCPDVDSFAAEIKATVEASPLYIKP
ncbi:MAG TPA: dockerin type I domain-containing protein [Anaerolineae bacterium]|nr:dockerin type I domain-containing protein [Anaerolineae bacterium]